MIFVKISPNFLSFSDWLRAVWYCAESLYTAQSFLFKLLLRPLKGKWHKNKCGFLFYLWRCTFFIFCTIVLGLNLFLTPRSMILRGVSICYTKSKIWISWRKQNQKRNYVNPLVSGPGQFKLWKKLGVENLVGLSH